MMKTSSIKINVSDSIGAVSAALTIPDQTEYILTLAHGAGADMNHSFMKDLAIALADLHCASLRFNFPYMEKGSKRPDVPAVATKTVQAAINYVHNTFEQIPLFVSGKSFGGRMSSQLLAKEHLRNVNGIVFFGFPLHPAGEPGVSRAEHLHDVNVPMLFLQGTKDALAQLSLVEEVSSKLNKATLVTYQGADHSFKAGKHLFMEELARDAVMWMRSIMEKGNQQ